MRFADNAHSPRGEFELLVYRSGIVVEHYRDSNLIVAQASGIAAQLLGGDVADNSVSHIAFGDGSSPAAPENTLLSQPFTKPLDGHSYPDSISVTFSFSLGASEANGKAIHEFGLLTSGGRLYARKVRAGPLVKDSELSLKGTWRIVF